MNKLLLLILFSSFNLQSLDNYICGNNFKKLAKFVVDESSDVFEPESVKQGDIIFVRNRLEYLKIFFLYINPKIKHKYILITHNDDCSPSIVKKYIDINNIYAWFSINVDYNHPKLIPIPIGIGEGCYGKHYVGGIDKLNKTIVLDKKYLLYMNFNVQTNANLRMPVYKTFCNKPFCYFPKDCLFTPYKRMSPMDFLKDVHNSKFVLSPEGNGMDCYRTWESLYVNSIPVVKTSVLDVLLQDLPVLIVKDWSDITEPFLQRKYRLIKNKTCNLEKLSFSYWKNLILDSQHRCLSDI